MWLVTVPADDFLDAEESDGDDAADPAAYSYDDLAAAFEDDGAGSDDEGEEAGDADPDGEQAQDEEEPGGVLGWPLSKHAMTAYKATS